MITVDKSWGERKPGETICCDKCGAVGVLADARSEGRPWILDWRCGFCGDNWFTRDPQLRAYQDA